MFINIPRDVSFGVFTISYIKKKKKLYLFFIKSINFIYLKNYIIIF